MLPFCTKHKIQQNAEKSNFDYKNSHFEELILTPTAFSFSLARTSCSHYRDASSGSSFWTNE